LLVQLEEGRVPPLHRRHLAPVTRDAPGLPHTGRQQLVGVDEQAPVLGGDLALDPALHLHPARHAGDQAALAVELRAAAELLRGRRPAQGR
jgi:hypothetical protein